MSPRAHTIQISHVHTMAFPLDGHVGVWEDISYSGDGVAILDLPTWSAPYWLNFSNWWIHPKISDQGLQLHKPPVRVGWGSNWAEPRSPAILEATGCLRACLPHLGPVSLMDLNIATLLDTNFQLASFPRGGPAQWIFLLLFNVLSPRKRLRNQLP